MFLEAASKVTGIFLPSQARLVGKKRDSPQLTSFQGFCAARVKIAIAAWSAFGVLLPFRETSTGNLCQKRA
jgi:hypothetical protein